MAGRERAGRAAAVDGHRGGLGAHQEWEARLAEARWSVVSWPRGVPRPRGLAGRVGDLRGGVLPRRCARPGLPERHLPARADHLRPRHPGAAGPLPAVDGDRRADLGAGLVRARGRLRPGVAASTARRDDERGGWVLNGQKTWSSRATYAHWGFGLFRSDPEAERHRGLTYFLFPLDADGVTVRPIAQLDGEAGFAEIFFEDVFVPDADVLGAPGDGWRVAMSTAGNERGLSLRSPGRFCAAADRLVDLYRSSRPTRALGRRRGRRLDQGAGLPPLHLGHGHPARRRRRHGRGRLGQQGVLVRARHRPARDRARPARRRGRARVALAGRLHVLAVRARSTPAPTRSSATSSPSASSACPASRGAPMRFELTEDQRDFAALARVLLAARRHRAVARAWADGDHEPGLKLWARLAEQGVTMLATEATPVEVCVAFEALGPARRARPLGRVRGVPAGGARPRGRGRSPRSPCRRTCRYALDADVADEVYVGTHAASPTSGDALVGRPDPAAVRRSPGDRRASTWTRPSTWPCSRPRPSCSAPASGCWPTPSPT